MESKMGAMRLDLNRKELKWGYILMVEEIRSKKMQVKSVKYVEILD